MRSKWELRLVYLRIRVEANGMIAFDVWNTMCLCVGIHTVSACYISSYTGTFWFLIPSDPVQHAAGSLFLLRNNHL